MPSKLLKKKIGQMLMFGVKGYEFTSEMRQMIDAFHMGGFIYFKRNVQDSKQLFALNKTIQDHTTIPLFIGIDQEGGLITAIEDITPIPGAMATSAARDYIEDYQTITYHAGRALKALGFSMNFAPNGDINNNKDNPVINARSYGDTKEVVTKYTEAMIQGFEQANLISTIKHFPGHGDTNVDSHLGLPTIEKSLEALQSFEMIPFIKAIDQGVPAIMTAHILMRQLDDQYPATLSEKILKKLCREQLKFNGLLITDLLSMHAIKDHFSLKETIVQAVNASNDILLYDAPSFEGYEHFVQTFYDAVDEGLIKVETIEASYKRIMHAKKKYHVGSMAKSFHEIKPILMPEVIKLKSDHITKQSMTLVKGKAPKIDFSNALIVFPNISIYSLIDTYNQKQHTFNDYLQSNGIQSQQLLLSEHEDQANLNDIIETASKYKHVVIFTYNSFMYPQQKALIKALDLEHVIVISLRAPYDGTLLQNATYLCAYEATKQSFKAIYDILNGDAPKGKLPVTI